MSELRTLVLQLKRMDPKDPSRDGALDSIMTIVATKYRERMMRWAGRYFLPGTTREEVVQDVLTKFYESLQLQSDGAFTALSEGKELPYLRTSVKNKCLDILRNWKREKDKRERAARDHGAPVGPANESSGPADVEKGAFLLQALQRLSRDECRLLHVDLGWDETFNYLHGSPPSHGDSDAVAEYLGMTKKQCYQHRDKAKSRLREMAQRFEGTGEFDAAQALRMLAEGRPPRDGFSSPYYRDASAARYALHIVEAAALLGKARTQDILRALEQADFIGLSDAAQPFLKLIVGPGLEPANLVEKADVLTATAVLFDHLAARAERTKDWLKAERLIADGLDALNSIFTEQHDAPAVQRSIGNRYTRVVLQQGILLRRLHEVKHHDVIATDSEELRRARELFYLVTLVAERPDHRISGLHQVAVCELVAERFDDAEAKLHLCLDRWDSLSQHQPDEALEYYFRSAYEHRRLGNVAERRMVLATDDAEATQLYYASHDQYDESESISRRCGNFRYVDELQDERRKLDILFASRRSR